MLDMDPILLVFLTGVRHDLGVLAGDGQRYGPGFGEEFRIFECGSPLDAVVVEFLEMLDDMQLITMLMPRCVEPGPVVQADCVH